MICRLLMLVVIMAWTCAADAFESQLLAGLRVSVNSVPDPVRVDGVTMALHHASGEEVPVLARRIESWWKSQGSAIHSLQQGGWTLRSRMIGPVSEVLQWKEGAAEPVLIYSRLDSSATVILDTDTGISLPGGCYWGRAVSGKSDQGQFLQRSARCSQSARELARSLQRSLSLQGWKILFADERGLQIQQHRINGLLSFTEGTTARSTWLTWLRVERKP